MDSPFIPPVPPTPDQPLSLLRRLGMLLRRRSIMATFPRAAYEEMGFSQSEIEQIRQLRRERAAGGDETAFRKYFRRDLHAGLVRNLRKVGVLSERVAPDLAALGISLAAA